MHSHVVMQNNSEALPFVQLEWKVRNYILEYCLIPENNIVSSLRTINQNKYNLKRLHNVLDNIVNQAQDILNLDCVKLICLKDPQMD